MALRDKEQRGFRYQKRSKDDVRERANMKGGNFDQYIKPKFKMWKPKDGKNLIRILPPTWDKAKHYGFDIFVNYGIGADNQSYLSLSKMLNEKDPLLEAKRVAEREGNKDLAKALSPNQRICYWLIDRNEEDEGPQLWPAPFTFDRDLANVCFDEDTKEVVFIDDPETGCDVRFYKEGALLKTKYDPLKIKLMKPCSLHEDEGLQNEWLDFIQENPVPECLNYYSYDHISNVYDGGTRAEPDEDEEKPARSRGKVNEDEDEAPAKRDRTTAKEGRESSEAGLRRTRAARDEDEAEEKAVKPARNRIVDEEEEVKPTRRKPPTDEDEETDESPRSSRRGKIDPDEDEETDEKPARGQSIREKLAARRGRSVSDD